MSTRSDTRALGLVASTVVHAAGHDPNSLWRAAIEGRSGLRRNDLDWCSLDAWIGRVPGVEDSTLPSALAPWDCRNHRLAWMALRDPAFAKAVEAAIARHGAGRIGLLLGTSTAGIRSTEEAYAHRRAEGRWPPGFDWRRSHSADAMARFVAEALGLRGPMTVLTTACSSSTKTFLAAQRWIEAGLVDATVVGGADSLCLSTLHGFDALQLLSDDVCRPFDAARRGISIGEAAGFALLAREPAAVSLLGGGESSDAYHMSAPHPEGRGARDAMRAALESSGLAPRDIGYVNAHGTATPANDRAEASALAGLFGPRGVPVSSSKGITGHTLGACGVVEAIMTAQALEHALLPPSAMLLEADPNLPVDIVREARAAPAMRHAMSNNFGFGGSNCSLVFRRGD